MVGVAFFKVLLTVHEQPCLTMVYNVHTYGPKGLLVLAFAAVLPRDLQEGA